MLNKSKRNYETGIWAENKSYFDVAISRYYYSIYQKIIYLSVKFGFYENPPKDDKAPHDFTLKNFRKHIYSKLNNEEIGRMSNISRLKIERVSADYIFNNEMKDFSVFNLRFKKYFLEIDKTLDSLIKRE